MRRYYIFTRHYEISLLIFFIIMKKSSSFLSINIAIITLFLVVYVLYIGSAILIPFVLAVFLAFILLSISSFYTKVWVPKYISFFVALITVGIVFYIIGWIVNNNIEEIIKASPVYQEKLWNIFSAYMEKYDVDQSVIKWEIMQNLDLANIFSSAATVITSIVKNAGLIFFFMVFILLESKSIRGKLLVITGGEKSQFFTVFEQVKWDIQSYFLVKTIASLSVGFLSLIIMYFFGLQFFMFWAFIIFLLNYIPSIWSIVAVCFPVLFSLVQFESLYITSIFMVLMIAAQVFIGNFLEPRILWNRLNLSPLVILFFLFFWWMLWGPIGMLLSVPIMVIINIVLAHIPATRSIAILLSEKWVIKISWDEKVSKMSLKRMKKILKEKL